MDQLPPPDIPAVRASHGATSMDAVRDRRRWSLTAAYYLAFVALGLAGAILGPTLPGLAEQTRTRLSEVSFLFTSVSVGYLAGSLLGGRLYDRMPGNPVMAAGLLIMTSTLALIPALPRLWLLGLVIVILGTAQGAVDVGGNTLLVWVHGRRVGPFMNGLHFFWGLGALISPIVVGQALRIRGEISWAFWVMAGMLLPAAVFLLCLRSPTPQGDTQDPFGATEAQVVAGPRPVVRDRTVVLLVTLLLFLFVGAEAGFGGWIYSYAVALDVSNATVAAYLTSTYWGALTLGRLVAIPIARWVRPRWILLSDAGGCLAGASVLLLWPGSSSATWVATICMGLFMASVFPTALTLAERRMTITGQITSRFLVGASMGGMTLPLLMGQLFDSIGPRSAMVLLTVYLILALGALLALLLYSERRLSIQSRL